MRDRAFAHPTNGYVEKIGDEVIVFTVLLGPFYLGYRRAWAAAVAWVFAAPVAFFLCFAFAPGPGAAVVFTLIAFVVIAFVMRPMIAKAYLRRGWREVTT